MLYIWSQCFLMVPAHPGSPGTKGL